VGQRWRDYSATGVLDYLPHDHARSGPTLGRGRPARICDRECRVCFSIGAVEWQRSDPQGRLFGVTVPRVTTARTARSCTTTSRHADLVVPEGALQVPHEAFPYQQLVDENRARASRSRARARGHRRVRSRLLAVTGGVRQPAVTISDSHHGHNRGEAARLHVLRPRGCATRGRGAGTGGYDPRASSAQVARGRWDHPATLGPLPARMRRSPHAGCYTDNETNTGGCGACRGGLQQDAFHRA